MTAKSARQAAEMWVVEHTEIGEISESQMMKHDGYRGYLAGFNAALAVRDAALAKAAEAIAELRHAHVEVFRTNLTAASFEGNKRFHSAWKLSEAALSALAAVRGSK